MSWHVHCAALLLLLLLSKVHTNAPAACISFHML
jgi:hypothetical protein